MIRTALFIPLLLLAGCQKQPAQTADAPAGASAPASSPGAAEAGAAASTASPPPDLSGEPVKGSVSMAEGAATTDANAPRPAPK